MSWSSAFAGRRKVRAPVAEMLTITSFWIKTMDNPIEQTRSTATGGGVILLPILAMWLLLQETSDLVIGLALPIVVLFSEDGFAGVGLPMVIAVALIIGLAMHLPAAKRFGRRLQRALLEQRAADNVGRKILTDGRRR